MRNEFIWETIWYNLIGREVEGIQKVFKMKTTGIFHTDSLFLRQYL